MAGLRYGNENNKSCHIESCPCFRVKFQCSQFKYPNIWLSLWCYQNIFRCLYGRGNSSKPINQFNPVNKEVYTGETIKWSNPTAGKPHPHIVAFISNQSTELKSKISNITSTLQ